MYYEYPYDDEHENRQFNLPEYLLWQMLGPGGGQQHGGNQHHGNHGGHHPNHGGGHYGGYPGPPANAGQNNPPSTPPPPFTPQHSVQTFAIDPGAIRNCRFRFTYVWTRNDAFWFYPTFIGRNSVSGFRWRRNRWVYFGIDLNQIQSFQCF